MTQVYSTCSSFTPTDEFKWLKVAKLTEVSENSVKIPQYAIEYDADKLTPTVQGSQSFPVTKKVDTQGYPKQEVQLCDTSIHVPLYCFLEDIIVKK